MDFPIKNTVIFHGIIYWGLASLSWTFIAPRPAPEIAAPAVLAALAPAAAQAVEMPEVGEVNCI